MKTNQIGRIVAMDLRKSHPQSKAYQTDAYYVKLANQILDNFKKLKIDLGEQTIPIIRYAAILLANYMEDIVADSGQWRSFSALCKQTIGLDVPIYHIRLTEYYPDEPDLAAVSYIVWHAVMEMDDYCINADNIEIITMATTAYDILDKAFEQSPINKELADDIDSMLVQAATDFHKMRFALIWLFSDCYLTRSYAAEQLIQKQLEGLNTAKFNADKSLKWFYAIMHSIFSFKIGPLALYPKDYLVALMQCKSMLKEAQEVNEIEVLPMTYYQFSIEEGGEWLNLLSTSGRTLKVARTEFTLDDDMLRDFDGCNTTFIKYLGAWNMNGVMLPIKDIATHWDELVRESPDYKPEGSIDVTGEYLLEKTGGNEIFYFANKNEFETFLRDKLNYKDIRLPNGPDGAGKYPLLFIDKNAKKYAMHISYAFTACIADPANPFYNKAIAQKEAIEMLWSAQGISTEIVLYLLRNNYLPDIYDDIVFSNENTVDEKRCDAQFLLRYMRKENY